MSELVPEQIKAEAQKLFEEWIGKRPPPHPSLLPYFPLVLYFPTREQAEEFATLVRAAMPGLVEHKVVDHA